MALLTQEKPQDRPENLAHLLQEGQWEAAPGIQTPIKQFFEKDGQKAENWDGQGLSGGQGHPIPSG